MWFICPVRHGILYQGRVTFMTPVVAFVSHSDRHSIMKHVQIHESAMDAIVRV